MFKLIKFRQKLVKLKLSNKVRAEAKVDRFKDMMAKTNKDEGQPSMFLVKMPFWRLWRP